MKNWSNKAGDLIPEFGRFSPGKSQLGAIHKLAKDICEETCRMMYIIQLAEDKILDDRTAQQALDKQKGHLKALAASIKVALED